MSDATNNEVQEIDLTTISPELRQVIEFDEVPKEMHNMVISIHLWGVWRSSAWNWAAFQQAHKMFWTTLSNSTL